MKKYYLVSLLACLVLFSSCSIIKTVSLIKGGSVDNENFTETINFEDRAGLIIIKVLIKGKSYDFVFDTGAPCAVFSELAQELGLKAEFDVTSIDSEGNKAKAGFVEINNLKTGSLSFSNIGAAVIDLKQIPEIECLKIDGIIGANLMNKAKWQINYQNNTITVTDDINNLNISGNSLIIDFNSSISESPLISL